MTQLPRVPIRFTNVLGNFFVGLFSAMMFLYLLVPHCSSSCILLLFLSVNGYAPATIASYISGIASTLRLQGSHDITKHFIVKRMLDGCRRRRGRQDQRRPITIVLLRRIIPALNIVCTNQYEALLFRVAFLLAFSWVSARR